MVVIPYSEVFGVFEQGSFGVTITRERIMMILVRDVRQPTRRSGHRCIQPIERGGTVPIRQVRDRRVKNRSSDRVDLF